MLQRENLLLSTFRKMVKKQWILTTLWHLWNFHRQRNELNGTNNWWTRFYSFFAINGYVFAQNHFWFWWQFCLQAWVLSERNISFRVLIWLYILIIKWLKTNWMLNIIFSIFLYGTIQTLYKHSKINICFFSKIVMCTWRWFNNWGLFCMKIETYYQGKVLLNDSIFRIYIYLQQLNVYTCRRHIKLFVIFCLFIYI